MLSKTLKLCRGARGLRTLAAGAPHGRGPGERFEGERARAAALADAAGGKDGEEVAREHLHAEVEPQLQKATSEGSPLTRGGAYASRDSVRANVAGPDAYEKTCKQLVEEKTAAGSVHPAPEGVGRPLEQPDADDGARGGDNGEEGDGPDVVARGAERPEGASPLGRVPDGVE